MSALTVFTKNIEWLELLSSELLSRICVDEFRLPDKAGMEVIKELEEQLDCYIMPYSLNIFKRDIPAGNHLCMNIKGASLSREEVRQLKDYEVILGSQGISLAAYQKPIVLVGK